MTLVASFSPPFADSQRAFRLISKAISEPGSKVSLPHLSAWGNASPAVTAVLMTLVDRKTPFWLDSSLSDEEMLQQLQRYGAEKREDGDAPVALLQGAFKTAIEQLSPDDSGTTIVIEVPALSGGLTLRLSGPELREPRAIAPRLPGAVLHYLRERADRFPQPIDLIFTCGDKMMALPHTTRVVVC